MRRLTGGDIGQRIANVSLLFYLSLYCFESPVRYLLMKVNASSGILARDLLILMPLAIMSYRGLLIRNIHGSFWILGLVLGFGDVISYVNFGSLGLTALGTKMLVNVLVGVAAGATLIIPGKWEGRYLLALWIATVLGLLLEKYVMKFPWIGMHAIVGGVDREISRDWQIGDPNSQRVAGFTKISISAAGVLSALGLVLVCRYRGYLQRLALLIITVFCVYLTTQKGALLGVLLVSMTMCGPSKFRLPILRIIVIAAVFSVVALPLFTQGLVVPQGHGGVFSAASFAERIDDTWPLSLKWIVQNQIFPFGDGVGGIGQSQAVLGTMAEHYPDNMFLLMYAFFGIPCLGFFVWMIYASLRSITVDQTMAEPGLAVLAFLLTYGIVVTVVEDQAGALFLGAAIGVLVRASPRPDMSRTMRMRQTLVAR